ncbi:hypothetical protein PM10SUCC1_02820 [Propionigenium maris DSM 9537]|uniref:Uncharacterized protein n=1 Tax=Propionigenium maris DSM 9537 TaxID=1123000 RepID=A0A9W6LLK6_9FUSO|nr:hypothetical protein PM10SUCC1_02820 [Propionigenium maris DSM 9537]
MLGLCCLKKLSMKNEVIDMSAAIIPGVTLGLFIAWIFFRINDGKKIDWGMTLAYILLISVMWIYGIY